MKNTIANKITEVWECYSTGLAVLLIIGIVIGALALSFGMMCLQAWLVMLLWNWIAVGLFGAPVLSFWLAFGLRWLCGLLFRSKTAMNKSED